jgi:hypothetical protein
VGVGAAAGIFGVASLDGADAGSGAGGAGDAVVIVDRRRSMAKSRDPCLR